MPLYLVTATRTTTLAHVIEATTADIAKDRMNAPGHPGFRDVIADETETAVDVEPYPLKED